MAADFGAASVPAQAASDELVDACGPDPAWLCEVVWNATNSRFLARIADDVVGPLLAAIAVVVVAAILSRYLRRGVTALITQVARKDRLAGAALDKLGVGSAHEQRDEIRAGTLAAVARTTVTTVIWATAVLVILGLLSINLGPLLASAGIAGIAVGLGAQSLVRDCIAGFFILLEDQCGVGDEIDIGPAIGTVESITMRATTLRDDTGTLWTVPNGTVLRIGNRSRDWSQGTVDVVIANAARLDDAIAIIDRVAGEVSALPEVAGVSLQPITTLGVQILQAEGPVVRLSVRTSPGAHGQGTAHVAGRADPRARRRRHRFRPAMNAMSDPRAMRADCSSCVFAGYANAALATSA